MGVAAISFAKVKTWLWRRGKWAAFCCLWLAALYLFFAFTHSSALFWDFRVYHDAAHALLVGTAPYSEYQVTVAYGPGLLPFVYPPATLYGFAILGFIPQWIAVWIWLVLKLMALVWISRILRQSFLSHVDARLALLSVFAFNAALFTDLITGNFATFEALLLLLALKSLIEHHDARFAIYLCLAAMVKVEPAMFLCLLIPFGGKDKWRVLTYSLLALLGYAALNALLWPQETVAFIQAAASRDELRANNPSLFMYCKDLSFRIPRCDPRLMFALVLCALEWNSYRIAQRTTGAPRRVLVLFAWLCVCFAAPRMMIYSYIELIPTAWIAINRLTGLAKWALIGFLAMPLPCSYLVVIFRPLGGVWDRILGMRPETYGYWALYGAVAVWAVFIMRVLPSYHHTPRPNS